MPNEQVEIALIQSVARLAREAHRLDQESREQLVQEFARLCQVSIILGELE